MSATNTKTPKVITLTTISDPGHGWALVPRKMLDEYGIADCITPWSYQSPEGHVVALEEDCDLSTLCQAIRRAGNDYVFIEHVTKDDKDAPCRNWPGYKSHPNWSDNGTAFRAQATPVVEQDTPEQIAAFNELTLLMSIAQRAFSMRLVNDPQGFTVLLDEYHQANPLNLDSVFNSDDWGFKTIVHKVMEKPAPKSPMQAVRDLLGPDLSMGVMAI